MESGAERGGAVLVVMLSVIVRERSRARETSECSPFSFLQTRDFREYITQDGGNEAGKV